MKRSVSLILLLSQLASLVPISCFADAFSNGYDESIIQRAEFIAIHNTILASYKDYLAKVAIQDCKTVLAQHKSGIIVSFVDKRTHKETQVMLECKPDGTADAYSAEEVAVRMQNAIKQPDATTCAMLPDQNLRNLYSHADRIADIVGAHAGKCEGGESPVDSANKALNHTNSCVASLEDAFFGAWKGKGSSGAPNCVQTLISVFIANFVSTGKFIVNVAGGAAKWTGTQLSNLWHSMMDSDNQNSNSVLTASAQSKKTVKALSKNESKGIWAAFQEFCSHILMGINQLMSNYVGCQHWSAQPFHSECIAPLNMSCLTCGQTLTLGCGVVGFIGSEAVMVFAGGFSTGAVSAIASSLAKTPQVIAAINGLSSVRAIVETAKIANVLITKANAIKMAAGRLPGVEKLAAAGRLPRFVMDKLVSRVPLNTEMRAIYARSVNMGAKTGDALMGAAGVGRVSSTVLNDARGLEKIERARDTFLKNSITIYRASSGKSAIATSKIRNAYQSYLREAKAEFESMGYTVSEEKGGLLLTKPDGGQSFKYEIHSVAARLGNTRKVDSTAQLMEYLRKEDNLFYSVAASGRGAPGSVPKELADALHYRQIIAARNGFEPQMAGRELARYNTAVDTNAKYNVNPDSKYMPIGANIY